MSVSMPHEGSHSLAPAPDVVSPELVLVDESLARHARARLEPPRDTLATVVSPPRLSVERDVRSAFEPSGRTPVPARRRVSLASGLVVRGMVGVGVAVVLVGSALLLSENVREPESAPVETGTDRARLSSTAVTVPPVAPTDATPAQRPGKPREQGVSSPPQRRGGASGERFAWAPVDGATGYHVELFSGSSLVFATETRDAQMVLPRTWTYRGERHRLRPGEYQWLVWAKDGAVRRSRAVVQAQLVVPAR
jgi:hypothetical protein